MGYEVAVRDFLNSVPVFLDSYSSFWIVSHLFVHVDHLSALQDTPFVSLVV